MNATAITLAAPAVQNAITATGAAFDDVYAHYMPKCSTVAMTVAIIMKLAAGDDDMLTNQNHLTTMDLLRAVPFEALGFALPRQTALTLDFLLSASGGGTLASGATLVEAAAQLLAAANKALGLAPAPTVTVDAAL